MPNTKNMGLIFPKSNDYWNLHLETSKSDPIGLHKVREYNPDRIGTKLFRQMYFSTSGTIGPYTWRGRAEKHASWIADD